MQWTLNRMTKSKKQSKKESFGLFSIFNSTRRMMKARKLRSQKRSESFMRGANVCVGCLTHTCRILILLFLCSPNVRAEVPTNLAIRAIIGEASSEGKVGMTAVAEAIRNRGHLKGVYGLKAKHVDREPAWVWNLASEAWSESENTNLVKGADHWENTEDFGVPYWAPSMKKTAQIGKHSFYKAVK